MTHRIITVGVLPHDALGRVQKHLLCEQANVGAVSHAAYGRSLSVVTPDVCPMQAGSIPPLEPLRHGAGRPAFRDAQALEQER